MTKIYEIQGKDRCQIIVYYCGTKITAEFKKVAGGTQRSQLVTADRFIQDALEHDTRYGLLYRCVRSFDEQEVVKAAEVREELSNSPAKVINTVKNLNDALVWFAKKGETPMTDEDVKQLMQRYNVAFPKWKMEKGEEASTE